MAAAFASTAPIEKQRSNLDLIVSKRIQETLSLYIDIATKALQSLFTSDSAFRLTDSTNVVRIRQLVRRQRNQILLDSTLEASDLPSYCEQSIPLKRTFLHILRFLRFSLYYCDALLGALEENHLSRCECFHHVH